MKKKKKLPIKDMLGKKCLHCGKDKYIEKATMFYTGRLVCPSCFHDIDRWHDKWPRSSAR